MDAFLPFCTYLREHPDFCDSDTNAEIEMLFQRQSAIDACISGKMNVDDLLDLLEFQGFDPEGYSNMVESNVEWVIRNYVAINPEGLV